MSNPTITIVGRLTRDPELRFSPSGTAVCNLSIATSDSRKTDTGREDVDASFWNCTAFKQLAEALADLRKGQAVVASGRIKQRQYENRDGQKVTTHEVVLDAIGPDLRWAQSGASPAARPAGDPWRKAEPAADPWAATSDPNRAADSRPPF